MAQLALWVSMGRPDCDAPDQLCTHRDKLAPAHPGIGKLKRR